MQMKLKLNGFCAKTLEMENVNKIIKHWTYTPKQTQLPSSIIYHLFGNANGKTKVLAYLFICKILCNSHINIILQHVLFMH